ncbi:osmoprotectant transport system ATP-binding protein [Salsuginibacillus halophilus]|uniref:Carnitine transport ATP-binding protein OpuCA n=1 Tax=Salsuginibacillus halophilus TaxID=517424 RepID=A0A2P8H9N1_9BACI|nr:ABC transporter ATP-binding protein [Salsuginibacillus halophilus]PSL42932.1 osmoprotectant transport system ATP-binding protein [Salsuginibacillus halophilus]
MIELQGVGKTYRDGTQAVKPLDLTIETGETVVLIGPSGCGKTTTLKMMNRLIEPSEGQVVKDGEPVQQLSVQMLRWNMGYVLQQIGLFPTMTIAENIAVVPEMKKWSAARISSRIDELLEMVGLTPATYRDRMPHELSGGQQQRVGVVRALAGDPDVLLMDEPFSALDPISRQQLREDLKSLQARIQKTMIFVTHDMDEALTLGHRIALMNEGKIVQLGTPQELLQQPADEFVRTFIGDRRAHRDLAVAEVLKSESRWLTVENSVKTVVPALAEAPPLSPSASLQEAAEILRSTDAPAVPVIEAGELLGTISFEDIAVYVLGGEA